MIRFTSCLLSGSHIGLCRNLVPLAENDLGCIDFWNCIGSSDLPEGYYNWVNAVICMGRHFLESIYNLMAKNVHFELILVVQRFLLN